MDVGYSLTQTLGPKMDSLFIRGVGKLDHRLIII